MRGGGQVLENEGEWRSIPEGWYGPKLSNVDPQPGSEIGNVGAFRGGRGEEFPR